MDRLTFQDLKRNNNWNDAVLVFKKESFNEDYSVEERSYAITRDAKYFDAKMISSSLFGNCLDGKDNGVRLDLYMDKEEKPWIVEYCYILD